jgi:hypothetical protein
MSMIESIESDANHREVFARRDDSYSDDKAIDRQSPAAIRGLKKRARRLAISPFSAALWRLAAGGTEPGHPSGILRAWPRWENFAHRIWPPNTIPGAPHGLLKMRLTQYRHEPLTLSDGTEIDRGRLIAEIHCNNRAILELVKSGGISPFRACREDLRSLAMWAAQNEVGRQVAAFFGTTILAPGAARLGFSVRPRPRNFRTRMDRMFMTGLLLLYTVEGLKRLDFGTTLRLYPQEVWMSRAQLLGRYGDTESWPPLEVRDSA